MTNNGRWTTSSGLKQTPKPGESFTWSNGKALMMLTTNGNFFYVK